MTIKDVAERAGVSTSTVSIVLNNKGQERKISEKTQKKIWDVIREMGYHPNVVAGTLRSNLEERFTYYITIFWTSDERDRIMIRFLRGLQEQIMENNLNCELIIKPYINGQLQEAMTERVLKMCHGIILCNASEQDMEFIDSVDLGKPMVIYNRYSDNYCSVNIDDQNLGEYAARAFIENKCKKILMLSSPARFKGMEIRKEAFENYLFSYHVSKPYLVTGKDTISSGYGLINKVMQDQIEFDSVFCSSDAIAIGAVRALHEKGVKIPKDVKVIAVGNGDDEQEIYAIPSLSVAKVPIEEMGKKCIILLYDILKFRQKEIMRIKVPVEYIARESCPSVL